MGHLAGFWEFTSRPSLTDTPACRQAAKTVYGLCLKYLQRIEDAKDAVSNIYEELNAKIRNYRIENFKAWLYSVTANHCLQILRKEKNRFWKKTFTTGNMPHLQKLPILQTFNPSVPQSANSSVLQSPQMEKAKPEGYDDG